MDLVVLGKVRGRISRLGHHFDVLHAGCNSHVVICQVLLLMSKATYDDVNLILRLYELRREEKMRHARGWFAGNFKCKSITAFELLSPEENAMVRQVTSYWDMAASFITAGVLNEELFFQSSRELLLVWVRIEPILANLRSAYGAGYMRNLEAVATNYAAHMEQHNPGTYQAFKARIGG